MARQRAGAQAEELAVDRVRKTLPEWIAWAFVPTVRRCHPESSYELNHRAERQIGRNVGEEEFKAVMVAAGHAPVDPRAPSWRFRVAFRRPEGVYGQPF